MTAIARAELQRRSAELQTLLMKGSSAQIIAAREKLRLSLVELQELGYWQDNPDEFQIHMRLYRVAAKLMFNPPASMSGLGKKVQYIP
ncbi:MAG: hypothetical protein B7Y00_02545 [Sphingomonadales bacterium 17-56-6]|nr:MAG: hypothetical protein B7Y44_10225 [Sphingomonadales bacterium 28-55-16]OYZ88984.1 MAG: hypothetical protein B7Y00_02545 [Sphingomonadales bacterium 17-56-6]